MPDPAAPPRILIRADARPELGGGHIMRCLSLAGALDARGAHIAFACAPGSAALVPALTRSGYPCREAEAADHAPLPDAWAGRADAIIIDLYSSTRADETRLRASAPEIAVIEDLPGRRHDCDLLVDQGFDPDRAAYAGRVPPGTDLLLGPDMAPLRPAFAALRQAALARRAREPGLKRILIAMGLTDLGGISARLVDLVRASLPDIAIDVVLGPLAASLPSLRQRANADPGLSVLVDIDNMAECMMAADLAIGAGGGTALERCVLGLPSIVIILAENQRPAARAMARAGAVLTIETPDGLEITRPGLITGLTTQRLTQMSAQSARLCDGNGANRIALALLARIDARRSRIEP
jgi:UDP-2,4-diacetamido-2,4,6-trideoxy-beta-L-altropyranose hydrolase